MKKISFILLTFLFVSLISCDEENQIDETTIDSTTESSKFLNSYFSESFSEGKSMTINNSMKVTEILGKIQETPIGYVVVGAENSKLLYFVEVNISKGTLTSIDFNDDKEPVSFPLTDFLENTGINTIDTFSMLDLLNQGNSSISSKRRFWGWSYGPCNNLGFRTRCHYIFWRENGCQEVGC